MLPIAPIVEKCQRTFPERKLQVTSREDGLDDNPACPTCPPETEDAEHVFFECPRVSEHRDKLKNIFGMILTLEGPIARCLPKEKFG
ncbi:hypothetical protein J437_LFUL005931 [Ladona fulva]|uniref:Reverse transcriptase zinc-binding domain-containing protein n=1 Tax=Ladona fulva TaxID=123851 RepID=A0A8K0JZE2_LADFU|nr:hypothetical protein J437_LFUL005931 [Ladona fulva]